MSNAAPSISEEEVARFSALAHDWWTPSGAFRVLHDLGPSRLSYIKERAGEAWGQGLRVLDVGCGGGVFAEALAREGVSVTALDASAEAIEVAKLHAAASGLSLDYRQGSVEDFAKEGATFDLVVALEIVEHVGDVESFLSGLTALVAPGGLLVVSSLNRTLESLALGVFMAEYVLDWIPKGTHDWRKFLRPSELASRLESRGFAVQDVTGLVYDMQKKSFALRKGKVAMDYFLTAQAES